MDKYNIVGRAKIEGHGIQSLILIDRSEVDTLGVVRVQWIDELGRRVSSFIRPYNLLEELKNLNV